MTLHFISEIKKNQLLANKLFSILFTIDTWIARFDSYTEFVIFSYRFFFPLPQSFIE